MPSKIVKQKNFERNTRLIRAFCDEFEIDLVELNDGYQLRLEDMIDLYPVRARWHNIKTGERGDWNGYKDLRRVMLAALEMVDKQGEIGKVDVTEVDNLNPEYTPATFTQEMAKKLSIRVEQQIRIVMKPKPKFLTEKMWLWIAARFIYVEKTEPKITQGKGQING
jgi:hypothetical protein